MTLDDFVMLGTTVPEPNSDGRVFVCSAGVSPEYGKLIRIYPLARRNVPHRWGVYRVPLERNPKDNRPESFKIAGDRSPGAHEDINTAFEPVRPRVPQTERIAMLRRYVVGSIKEANAKRLSLAIIHPDMIELTFEHNPESPLSPQMALFDMPGEKPSGARRFAWMPRLKFHDQLGWNNLMLRDWGTFELQRKRGGDYFRQNLGGALHLDENSSLLVGNLCNQRTAWLVISVLNGIREAPTLFDLLTDERPRLSDKKRRTVYERDSYQCVRCGSPDELTVDHKMPYSRGGTDSLDNLQTLCKTCNLSKGDDPNRAALCHGCVSMTSSPYTAKSQASRMLHSACTSQLSSGAHGTSLTDSCHGKTSTTCVRGCERRIASRRSACDGKPGILRANRVIPRSARHPWRVTGGSFTTTSSISRRRSRS